MDTDTTAPVTIKLETFKVGRRTQGYFLCISAIHCKSFDFGGPDEMTRTAAKKAADAWAVEHAGDVRPATGLGFVKVVL